MAAENAGGPEDAPAERRASMRPRRMAAENDKWPKSKAIHLACFNEAAANGRGKRKGSTPLSAA